jgi:hypothetical protein
MDANKMLPVGLTRQSLLSSVAKQGKLWPPWLCMLFGKFEKSTILELFGINIASFSSHIQD